MCISSTYLLEKKTKGEFRQIVDLRPVNQHCVVPPCKFESLSLLPMLARTGDVTIAADLQDGYYALGIHPAFQKILCFTVGDVCYCCTALPFGLSLAPLIFTKLMRVVANFMRRPRFVSGTLFSSRHLLPGYVRKGFRCIFYLDDILVLS